MWGTRARHEAAVTLAGHAGGPRLPDQRGPTRSNEPGPGAGSDRAHRILRPAGGARAGRRGRTLRSPDAGFVVFARTVRRRRDAAARDPVTVELTSTSRPTICGGRAGRRPATRADTARCGSAAPRSVASAASRYRSGSPRRRHRRRPQLDVPVEAAEWDLGVRSTVGSSSRTQVGSRGRHPDPIRPHMTRPHRHQHLVELLGYHALGSGNWSSPRTAVQARCFRGPPGSAHAGSRAPQEFEVLRDGADALRPASMA